MTLLAHERDTLIEYGKKLTAKELTVGTGGNISMYNQESGYMAITPSGLEYDSLALEDIVIMDLAGNVVEGIRKPSSEYQMHALVYQSREDIHAMVHTHAIYATTISALNIDLPAVDYLVAHSGGKNVRCAEYATFGTEELAQNALKAMEDRKVVLLANHGINAVGVNMDEAFNITEQLEFCAKIYWQAKSIGEPVILDDEEMDKMVDKFKTYGQPKEQRK